MDIAILTDNFVEDTESFQVVISSSDDAVVIVEEEGMLNLTILDSTGKWVAVLLAHF